MNAELKEFNGQDWSERCLDILSRYQRKARHMENLDGGQELYILGGIFCLLTFH